MYDIITKFVLYIREGLDPLDPSVYLDLAASE